MPKMGTSGYYSEVSEYGQFKDMSRSYPDFYFIDATRHQCPSLLFRLYQCSKSQRVCQEGS